MSKEQTPNDDLANELRRRLKEQDELAARFDTARDADYVIEDIQLDPSYSRDVQIKDEGNYFLIKYFPTGEIRQLSVMNGPNAVRRFITQWVNIHRGQTHE